jgi:phosphonate metabolism protein PhnN/1,5-bisphosphokinase (PRPP-forming)
MTGQTGAANAAAVRRGSLVLVVGPSGAGKDTLIRGARSVLAGDDRFVFPRRLITRPRSAGGEDHQAVGPAEFDRMAAEGALALQWAAHGCRYAIPAEMEKAVAAGRCVIANVSRTIIDEARRRFRTRIVLVTAPTEVLRSRLAARAREDAEQTASRLSRAGAFAVSGDDVVEIVNDRTPEHAIARFVAVLREAAAAV